LESAGFPPAKMSAARLAITFPHLMGFACIT
jgi:hypothetical protein